MGTRYDGVCFFGCVFSGEDGWPKETKAVLGGKDLWDWLDQYLKLPGWSQFLDYAEYKAERERRCMATFGVPWFEQGFIGYIECSTSNYVAPTGAVVMRGYAERVPEWSTEQIATWRAALAKLQAVLPGGSEPGLYFGCTIG